MPLRAGRVLVVAILLAVPLAAQRARETPRKERSRDAAACRVVQGLTPLQGLREASGLAVSRSGPTRFFSINDSAEPEVVVLDVDGTVRSRVRLDGATVTDWEDVTTGPCPSGTCLIVADVGDNDARRDRVTLFRVAEPADGARAVRVERIDLAYPDGPHDAEALFAGRDGRLYLLTKEPRLTRLYRLPMPLQPRTTGRLELVATLEAGTGRTRLARVTDAETSPDGATVAIRTNDALFLVGTDALVAGRLTGLRTFPLRSLREPQGEGVAIGPGGDIFLAGESGSAKRPDGTFARIACPAP